MAKLKDGVYQLKNAAILLFAKDPEKYISSASVRYVRYEGTEALTGVNLNVVKDERFETNIPNLIDELKVFLKASFKEALFVLLSELQPAKNTTAETISIFVSREKFILEIFLPKINMDTKNDSTIIIK